MIYGKLPAFVLGFHGCDRKVKERVLLGKTELEPSKNCYDWLGSGIYFWENDPERALDYAKFLKENPNRCVRKIEEPDVIGAVIDLGYCLNLFEKKNLDLLALSYKAMKTSMEQRGLILPKNKGGKDLLRRELDCAVINFLTKNIEDIREKDSDIDIKAFDSVRAPFWEGSRIYKNAGFREKNHIQICVINNKCIKGYFNPVDI